MSTPLTNLQKIWQSQQRNQTRVAEDLGISQPALSQYLRGKVPLNTDFILKVAKILNVNPLEIDPALQHLFLPKLQRIRINLVNDDTTLDVFGSNPHCLGFRIPDNRYAPRFQQGDAIIFLPLETPQPNLHLLAYNTQEFHIGRATDLINDYLSINDTTIATTDFNFGVIESIIPK
jgi:transcriptional regulator with XRE-family HTH domain